MRIVIASLVFSDRFCLNRWLAADGSNHALLYVCLMRDELAPLFGEPRQLPEPMGRILPTASLCKLGAGSSALGSPRLMHIDRTGLLRWPLVWL